MESHFELENSPHVRLCCTALRNLGAPKCQDGAEAGGHLSGRMRIMPNFIADLLLSPSCVRLS